MEAPAKTMRTTADRGVTTREYEDDTALAYDVCVNVVDIITIYVDDILVCTDTDEEVDAIINHMQTHILLSDMDPVAKLLGMEIYRNEDEMTMDVLQVAYIERMAAKYGLASAKASAIGSNQASIQRTKHLALHFYFLWDLVKSRKFTLTHLPTNVMPADVFTKHVPKDKLKAAMAFMGMGGCCGFCP
ncbi:hypothetical protein DYB31_009799 [Aphanomyces astaci]|uniref:Reverse transcriptase Ty1/copia-type domain-containing protein n=1 Tax=Aphanomyces astaci TaxID=112090 RepID=A0A397F2L7_APHAT|nr:hypothetical protein DYB31_009799 [Aphanomyces astaci]